MEAPSTGHVLPVLTRSHSSLVGKTFFLQHDQGILDSCPDYTDGRSPESESKPLEN